MQSAPTPSNEAERLRTLRSYDILDTVPEPAYDDITYIASQICETPIALVSLVDTDRQWFKSKVGLEAEQTDRDVAFCSHALLQPDDLFVVEDAADDVRFADNPLVTMDPSIRFYAGAPLVTEQGVALGTLCVIDRTPRKLDAEQSNALSALARQVMAQFELRRALKSLADTSKVLEEVNGALENSNRDLERFAFIAAHDLKEPLRMISSFGELLAESTEDRLTEEESEFLGFIRDGATRGQTLTSDILQYAKLEQDEERAWVPLETVVAAQCRTATQAYPAGHVVWDEGETLAWGNEGLIEHLLYNLITNGLKYNENARPTVQVGIKKRVQGIALTVQDNGIGIKQELLDKVFDMFYRGHDRARYEGTGIGLAICRRVMELHGGSIAVKSEPDHGSTFTCLFPHVKNNEAQDGSHHNIAG